MPAQVIKGCIELGNKIRKRRMELGLTIEEAAKFAGIGTKTWSRYESGESIRKDKYNGICKTLRWNLEVQDSFDESSWLDIDRYKKSNSWSEDIANRFGINAAVAFAVGFEILMDEIEQDMDGLSKLTQGAHIGMLDFSMVKELLPAQFLMKYNYDFLYLLSVKLRELVWKALNDTLVAHSVLEEILIYMIVEESNFLEDSINDFDNEWIFDLFDDTDILLLYEKYYFNKDSQFHFDNWNEKIFWIDIN